MRELFDKFSFPIVQVGSVRVFCCCEYYQPLQMWSPLSDPDCYSGAARLYRCKADCRIDRDIEKQIADVHECVQAMEYFIENVRDLGTVSEFDAELWGLLVDRVIVYNRDDVRVEFRK